MRIAMDVDDKAVRDAYKKSPRTMRHYVGKALLRGGIEVARLARRNAPKALTSLTHSIVTQRIRHLKVDVIASANYARAVEEGTGPGANPPVNAIKAWLKVRKIQPRQPDTDLDDLAYIVSRSINAKGISAQPFMAPALKSKENRVKALVFNATAKGLEAVGL